jgi:histidine ammonia-lyase
MAIVLDGHSLRIEDVVRIARYGEQIAIHEDAKERINKCRALLESKIKAREIMYGVNTGIGELSEVVLTPEQVEISAIFPRCRLRRTHERGGCARRHALAP